MRPAVVQLRDLSQDDIREITRLLSRRPDYGIARPSARWLSRQEEKIEELPRILLTSKNMIHRLAISLVWKHDKRQKDANKLLPPSAILCHSHERLNPFLIRSIFLAFINEVSGDHMSALRVWPGKNPRVAAFLTRVDSLHAFWTSKEAFQALFGTAPHDDRYVRITNNCEACILAAIGANGRILADIYGWLTVRRDDNKKFNEEARARGETRRKRGIYLLRMIDAWIKHLKPEDGNDVRRRGDEIAAELRHIWVPINKVRSEIMTQRRIERVNDREIRPSKDGRAQMIEAHGRSLGFGIPLPRTDLEAAALQRNMAGLHKNLDNLSVYREDTVINGDQGRHSEEIFPNFQQQGPRLQEPPGELYRRPGAPGPYRTSGLLSAEQPRESSVDRPAAKASSPYQHQIDEDELYEKDETYQHEYDERDYFAEKESVNKVQSWYAMQAMNATKTNLNNLDRESIHPALQRPMTSTSAVPPPLHLRNGERVVSYQPARAEWEDLGGDNLDEQPDNSDAQSVWTDKSVYTTADAFDAVNLSSPPPIPEIPAPFRADYNIRDRTPTVSTPLPNLSPDQGNGRTFAAKPSHRTNSSRRDDHSASQSPHHDAFTRPPPRPPQTKAGRRKYLFHDDDSDTASHLTQTNKKYLRQYKGKIKEVPPEANPFVRQDSKRLKRPAERDEEEISPTSRSKGQQDKFEGYAALNREAEERTRHPAKYQAYAQHNNAPPTPRATRQNHGPSNQSANIQEAQWGNSNDEDIRPLDSASNIAWKRRASDNVTTWGGFINQSRRRKWSMDRDAH
ncbi:hypothetical protein SCARD494_04598 [Seiridium cardinale]